MMTENKVVSHLLFKSYFVQGTEQINSTFIKKQLMIICDPYNLKIKKRLRKSEIIDKLKEHILASGSMPNAQVLCKTS